MKVIFDIVALVLLAAATYDSIHFCLQVVNNSP